MGAVYQGEHVMMRKAVAVKVLHREMTVLEEVVQRFEREAIAAGRIDHPNVAAASDFGRLPDGSFYLVLEYVAGRSLGDALVDGPMPLDRTLAIAAQVADALVAAHAAGIVHRDLKPDNVMLVEHADGKDHVKVLDFGIAKLDGASPAGASAEGSGKQLTRIGAVMGTAGYMAPEQALGQAVDARADLYALGVLLYEMIAGRPPYVADDFSQILAKQITERPPPLPEGTPAELSDLVDRLLRTTPSERPESAAAVAKELAHVRAPRSVVGGVDVPSVRGVAQTALEVPRDASSEKRGMPRVALAALLAAALIGGVVAWRASSGSPEPASSASASVETAAVAPSAIVDTPSAPSAAPSVRAVESPAPKPASSAPIVTGTSHTETSVTETKTTSGGRVTTTKTTKKKTTVEQHSESSTTTKRRTGPGGIYIPPPSQWYK